MASRVESSTPATNHPLLPMLLALRLTGRIPFSLDSGHFQFKLFSWPTIYSIVITVSQFVIALDIVNWVAARPYMYIHYEGVINVTMAYVIMTFITHPVLFTWAETPHIATAVNQWPQFMAFYNMVVNRPISSTILDHPWNWTIFVTMLTIFVQCVPIFYGMYELNLGIIIVYGMIYFYINMITLFWLVFTHLVSRTATLLKHSLLKSMRCTGGPSVKVIREHRYLWLELNSFTAAIPEAIGNSLTAWEFLMVLSLVLGIYRVVSIFILNGFVAISSIVHGVVTAIHVVSLHSASQWAETKIGRDIIVAVLSCNLHKYTVDQINEVELLIFAVESSTNNFILKGIMDFKRNSVLEIIQAVLTIIVILVQFKSSSN